jgi:diguanylate cyclase (GGDEF)-like protein
MQAGELQAGATYRYRCRDGRWAWLEARAHLVRPTDCPVTEFIGLLRDVTRQKEAELALEAAMAKLSLQATTDALTGIANRRRFDEVLAREWRRAMRVGDPLSLLLIDVDHFKAFNDRYGHQGGDECLCRIAETIAGVIRRPHDLVARSGGEEFVAVLPATAADGAGQIAEAARAAVAAMVIPQMAGTGAPVTISIGVATAIPAGDATPAALIEAADAALYLAKRGGRNRIELAGRADVALPLAASG